MVGIDGTLGFLNKIKKLLETVCHNCGKILVDEVRRHLWDDHIGLGNFC